MISRRFHRAPFKRKLTLITMVASGLALLLAAVSFTTYEVIVFRGTVLDHLGRVATMLGDNSSAALAFREPSSATQTLRSLAAEPHIVAAEIYDEAGNVFARYRSPAAGETVPRTVSAEGHRFGEEHLELVREINAGGERIGTIRVVSSLSEMRARMWRYVLIVLAVLAMSSVCVLLLSHSLHRSIVRPIEALSGVAGEVATRRNYAIRATKETEDEVGRLVDGFNEMLAQIQLRDAELARAHESLEARVAQRTHELEVEVAERRRSVAALLESNQRFEIVTRATTDVIWDWDVRTDEIWWNDNFQTVFGHHMGPRSKAGDSWVPFVHPDDAGMVLGGIDALFAGSGHLWFKQYRFRRADGRYATVSDRGYVLRDSEGRPTRMIGALQDVTQQREAEAELARTHRELVAASRRAGQAEVATSVLHNVGNVLNSVMVSATVAVDRMRALRVTHAAQTAELLQQHRAELGPFFTENAKGRMLLDYLPQLARMLEADRSAATQELEALMRHIEHIKEIVTRQQGLAKTVGVLETVPLAAIVEDALALNSDSLARHTVAIERRYAAVPAFPVDKHRVMEIVVNLIQNAKEAVKAGTVPGRRRIDLEILRADGRAQIRVADNGVGIAPENLTRIFQHGFTTRRDGHGFGLHSGALAARQLGGSLAVNSDGPGRGATFILEIPITRTLPC